MIQKGSMVKIHYTLKVDGELRDTSQGREPLEFKQGEGQIISGLDAEIAQLDKGQKKDVTVSPEDGYGQPDPNAVQKIPKTAVQGIENLKPGERVQGQTKSGPVQATVVEITEKEVTLDFNHPLAGKTLNFEVEVVEVNPPA